MNSGRKLVKKFIFCIDYRGYVLWVDMLAVDWRGWGELSCDDTFSVFDTIKDKIKVKKIAYL